MSQRNLCAWHVTRHFALNAVINIGSAVTLMQAVAIHLSPAPVSAKLGAAADVGGRDAPPLHSMHNEGCCDCSAWHFILHTLVLCPVADVQQHSFSPYRGRHALQLAPRKARCAIQMGVLQRSPRGGVLLCWLGEHLRDALMHRAGQRGRRQLLDALF